MNTTFCSATAQTTLTQWCLPSTKVGSGHDSRSSHNGLLTIFFGSLENSARFGWLNAGRTLVDKTYLSILWQAAELPSLGVDFTRMASSLDAFVRAELEPRWPEFEHLHHSEKQTLSISLTQAAAEQVFGSGYQEQCASWLLFYLCPQLPLFPFNSSLQATIAARLDQPVAEDYALYQQQCRQLFSRMLPGLHNQPPVAEYGSDREQRTIDQILQGSDWWQRHCFIQQFNQ